MLAYWFLLPLLLGATFAGLGLGVRRLSVPFSAALLVPLGYCVAIIVSAIVTWSGHTKDFTGPVVAALALAGWVFSAGELKRAVQGGALRRGWPWIAAGVAGFLVYAAVNLAAGKPTYTGYNEIVDMASQMQWAAFLADFGRHPVGDVSFWVNSGNGTPLNGYPAGPQALLATYPKTFGFNMAWSWDVYLSMMAACVVTSAYVLIKQVTPSRTFAAIGAFAVGQASPMIGYGHLGGIKELSAVATLLVAAALIPTAAAAKETTDWRAALPFAIALSGAFSVFSLTILPWLGILAAGAFWVIWKATALRTALIRAGIALGVFVLVTLPTSIPAKDSLGFAEAMVDELGNLANPVSKWAATGVWITPDHRFSLEGPARTISIVIGVIVLLLLCVGLWHAVRKRAPALLVLFAATIIGFTLIAVRMGQWIEFKAIVMAAPAVLLLAVVGLAGVKTLGRQGARPAAWAGLIGLLLVGVYTDVIRFGHTKVAPHDRLMELRAYGQEFKRTRATLIPDWDENGGHEMNDANAVQAFNTPFEPSEEWAKDPARPGFYQYEWDLDQIYPPYANKNNLIVLRRSPGQSRPGQPYRIVREGRFFTVWERTPAPATVAHLPMAGIASPQDVEKCKAFVGQMPKTATVTVAKPPAFTAPVSFDPAKTSSGLSVFDGNGTVLTNGNAGTSEGTADVGPRAGLFEIFAKSTNYRSTKVTIAGKTFEVERDPSAALRSQYLGTVSLADGVQSVKLEVGGRSLFPGTSKDYNKAAYVGGVELIPKGTLHPPLVHTVAGSVRCEEPIDWIETP